MDLTQCQERLAEAGRKASAAVRRLKPLLPVEAYDELMLAHCAVAASSLELKTLLGSLRMTGELEQRPAPVTAESLELFAPYHDRMMDAAGDHTLAVSTMEVES